MIDLAARTRVEQWKLSLLDRSAGSRLLDVQDARTTIPLVSLDPAAVAAALSSGAGVALAPQPADADPGDGAGEARTLRSSLGAAELARRLVAVRRAARARLADGCVHVLWLGLGMLAWVDAMPDGSAGSQVRRAPLALWPVELAREAGGGLRLVQAAGLEPCCNPALRDKLRRDFGIVLPGAAGPAGPVDPADAGDRDEVDVAALLAATDALVAARPGWRLDRAAELGIFELARLAMWHDLDAQADELFASPMVAQLAARTGTAFVQPSPEAAHAVAPGAELASELIAPLDADASQLAAVAAAGAGASFVLQGPPGTGKSQTIANLIVHAVASGKTVLFVSNKAAALDAVQHRLAAVGLGEVCLALHGDAAVPARVIGQLGRVLERAFRPVAGPARADARLAELRAALDDHAAAMHRTGRFGRSLHEVLGRLVELRSTPRAPLAERDTATLDRAAYERRRIAVAGLAAAGAAVEPVAAHPWRAAMLERWPLDGRERASAALDEAARAGRELEAAVREIQRRVPGVLGRTRGQLLALGQLAALAATSPRPGAELLTQLRAGHGDDVVEKLALIRARGAGEIDPPRDPASFLVLASRHRALVAEVSERFTDDVERLDARALWSQLRRWARRPAAMRFLALRGIRAEVRAAARPGSFDDDAAMIGALESVIAERAARAALLASAGPARRWFGELGGNPLALDLDQIDAAVGWAGELRRAFDAIAIAQGAAAHGERAGAGEPGPGRGHLGGDARAAAWRALVAQVSASPTPDEGGAPSGGELAALARLGDAVARWRAALAALAEATGIDEAALGTGEDHLGSLGAQIEGLGGAIDGLRDWVAFHAARCAAQAAGVGPAIAALERGDLGAGELAAAWERATLLAWADAELAAAPALARFHGAAHHAQVAEFADLDRATLALVRSRALVRIAERVPRVSADPGGELGVLLHELKRPHGHRSLRRLFGEIPTLLPRLAPCLLMSPATVAQYLDPALPRFDLVVFDEASQLPTAEAIGALARSRAAVVVGDAQQLPPARPDAAGADDPGGRAAVEEASDEVPDEVPGLLGDCVAAGLPELRLTWHYRSRHEDLFAFANRRYYGDRVQVIPAAHGSPDLGLTWRPIDGRDDHGGTGHDRREAEAVAAEVIARLRDPAQRARSLAVVAFSRAQQALIEDLLDAARAEDAELDGWFEAAHGGGEPVLIKHVDAAQGDERDVVLLSVGYGPDARGALPRSFGVLSRRGGERRLNVAITRAREQLVVFSSIAPEDLDPGLRAGEPAARDGASGAAAGGALLPRRGGGGEGRDGAGQGVADLAELIAFARAGGGAARPAAAEAAAPASPVTAAIARALVDRGWIVRHQVGCGGYKLDLAIVDPADPDRYVLAIEHDGAAYASAGAARDRDRLRAQGLAQLGWRVHRIWTLDWWADPDREIQRAHGAIVAAVAASRQRRSQTTPPGPLDAGRGEVAAAGSAPVAAAPRRARTPSPPGVAAGSGPTEAGPPPGGARSRDARGPVAGLDPSPSMASLIAEISAPIASGSAPVRIARNSIAIGPYLAAAIPAGRRAPDDLFASRHLGELGKIIEQVLAAEAPVHLDVLARRVAAYFGIGRPSPRVTEQVKVALAGRGRWGEAGEEDDVVWRLDQDPAAVPAVRVAGHGASARREIHEVPLAEVAAAARIVVERAAGIPAGDLVRDSARLLGFARLTDRVLARVASGVRLAAERELIRIEGGRAVLPDEHAPH